MNFVYPEKYSNKLTKKQINQWRQEGYLLIDNILEDNILHNAVKELNIIYPQINDIDKVNQIAANQDFGSKGLLEFPCNIDSINQVTLSHNIIMAAEELLGEEVRLLQSDAWSKYGGNKTNDSRNPSIVSKKGAKTGLFELKVFNLSSQDSSLFF